MAAGRIKGITIEIGGDSTKLVSALAKVDNALSKTQANLRDINKALKLDPGNTELLKDKQNELANAIKETKSKLDTEKDAYNQLAQADKTPENVERMRQLKTQIDLDTAALKDLENQAKQSSSILGSQMQVAGQKIQEVGEKIQSVGDKLSALGSRLTATVTAPIVGGFTAAVKTTGDFDAAMSKVQAVSGATASDVELLRQKAKEMGETTKFSASESAEALNYMAMAGWKTEDMLGGIEGIMNLAAASGEELGTTSDIVTDALTAFGYEAKDAAHFSDILASASSNANTNVAMMGESFKYAAPVAGSLGYSAEDVATALGLMANSGIKADMAGTSLRNLFNRMAKPTKESAMAMDRLGISLADDEGKMYSFRQIMDQFRTSMANINMPAEEYMDRMETLDKMLESGVITQKQYNSELEEITNQAFNAEGAEKARAAAMLGGTRAMAGMLAIANASEEDYEKLTSAIDNSSQTFAKLADGSVVPLNEALESGQEIIEQYSGSAEAMANTMLDNLPGQITILKSQLEALAISFGELLMPKIREVVGYIQGFVDKLNSMDDAQREQIVRIAAIVAAVGPALVVVGKITKGIGGLVSVVGKVTSIGGSLLSSLGGLSGILGAIASPIGIAVTAIGALAAAFAYLYNTNEDFRNSINSIVGDVKANFESMMTTIQPLLVGLQEAFSNLIVALGPVIEILKSKFQDFMSDLANAFQFIAQVIAGVANGLMAAAGPIISAVTNVINIITGIIQAFSALFRGDTTAFFEALKSIFDNALSLIQNLIQARIAFVVGFFKTFGVDIVSVATNLLTNIKTIVAGLWQTVTNSFSSGLNMAKSIVLNGVLNIKNTFLGLKNSIKSVFDNIINSMKQWGKDMIDNLVNGIKEKISAVKDAIGSVAETIASYIHFSVPDVGPLADADTYAPDMMKLFAEGIRANAGLISDAISSSFNISPLIQSSASQNALAAQGTDTGLQQPIQVNLTLEGDAARLFRIVNIEANRNRQITGNIFNSGY